ncbi:hypothetical protein PRIC1_006565 [Phytophthora ramorum]|uniref:MalT-like TPR region domain-containing protein n=1 Tax=Phytophthora ramorum TaxID=164328 RepID=H3GZ32_PHYRM|nr:hypothetical protein KRP23_12924 [Phytophthora ramorum]
MLSIPATRAVLRAARAASSSLQWHHRIAPASASAERWSTGAQSRLGSIETIRELSTINSKSRSESESVQSAGQRSVHERGDARVGELLEMIEESREEDDTERELEQSLELYEMLKQRNQRDADIFEVAFGIARIYDGQLEDGATATTYYEEALNILEAVSTDVTVWGVYMRVTTLGALAVCHETLGHPKEAEKYFDDAIGAYEEHCDQASASDVGEEDVSDTDISLLADLNATAAMIHYHYAGNLLAQERWEEAKNVTKIALVLAENSSMPAGDLEELQHCIHELWLEMD